MEGILLLLFSYFLVLQKLNRGSPILSFPLTSPELGCVFPLDLPGLTRFFLDLARIGLCFTFISPVLTQWRVNKYIFRIIYPDLVEIEGSFILGCWFWLEIIVFKLSLLMYWQRVVIMGLLNA